MRNLIIDDITVTHASYAILRRGISPTKWTARGLRIAALAIYRGRHWWNVAIHDRDILISDHVIERIDCTNGKESTGGSAGWRVAPMTIVIVKTGSKKLWW